MTEENFDWLSLDDDEEILWDGEPILKSIYPALAIGIPLAFVGIGILIIIGAYLTIKHTDFVVSTKGLYKKKGVLSRNVKKINFEKVQNISFSQGLFGKVFSYGNINISTAGGSGVEMRFQAINNPKEVQELINRQIQETGKEDGQKTAESSGDMDEVLTELQGIREVLEEMNEKL